MGKVDNTLEATNINLGYIPNYFLTHTSPHHQISTSKLNFPLHHSVTQAFFHILAHILPTIWPRQLILVPSNHQTSFQSSIAYSEWFLVNSILALLWWCLIKDFFHFTTAFMPLAELMMHCVRIDGNVGNILKCPSSLKSIINLPHVNNASNMVNICYSKLGWMITRRFEKVKMMLRVNSTNNYIT